MLPSHEPSKTSEAGTPMHSLSSLSELELQGHFLSCLASNACVTLSTESHMASNFLVAPKALTSPSSYAATRPSLARRSQLNLVLIVSSAISHRTTLALLGATAMRHLKSSLLPGRPPRPAFVTAPPAKVLALVLLAGRLCEKVSSIVIDSSDSIKATERLAPVRSVHSGRPRWRPSSKAARSLAKPRSTSPFKASRAQLPRPETSS
mmetsp:Transcript_71223/g.154798  ORF Transcript_71223/g.154798 Transcript_71223/m.154798 type:complete len:207 (+) Transcript_71223:745-1365(+)